MFAIRNKIVYIILFWYFQIFIVLELVTGGELFDRYTPCLWQLNIDWRVVHYFIEMTLLVFSIVAEGRLDEITARRYFRQLVSGVAYCHSKGTHIWVCMVLTIISRILKFSHVFCFSIYVYSGICHRDLKYANCKLCFITLRYMVLFIFLFFLWVISINYCLVCFVGSSSFLVPTI